MSLSLSGLRWHNRWISDGRIFFFSIDFLIDFLSWFAFTTCSPFTCWVCSSIAYLNPPLILRYLHQSPATQALFNQLMSSSKEVISWKRWRREQERRACIIHPLKTATKKVIYILAKMINGLEKPGKLLLVFHFFNWMIFCVCSCSFGNLFFSLFKFAQLKLILNIRVFCFIPTVFICFM